MKDCNDCAERILERKIRATSEIESHRLLGWALIWIGMLVVGPFVIGFIRLALEGAK